MLYAWIWRRLPGPLAIRVALAVSLVVAALAGLFLWGFPWLVDMGILTG